MINATETPTEDRVTIHKYILDPLSTIIKLSILSKKNVGCKICIYNNTIVIQDIGFFQSLVRYIYNNNKIDIQYIYNPIELACSYFLNEKLQPEKTKRQQNIKNLFIDAQKGILKLVETYKNYTIITHTLYTYYNIIANYLGDKFNDKLFIRDNISNIYNKELVDKLNNIWNEDRIKMVLNMIDFIDKDKGSENSVKCLEEFMLIIDKEVNDLIQTN
jgi:uncharacterized protein YqgQ